MALRGLAPATAVYVAPVASGRKQDRRTAEDIGKAERAAHAHEDTQFVRRVRSDANRLVRLIAGGLDSEAMQTAASLHYAAGRRATQLGLSPDEAA